MKLWLIAAVAASVSLYAPAQTRIKPCEDLKAEIAKKLDAKGVTGYTLTIVEKGKKADGTVVGSCDGGTKNIFYDRAKPAAQPKPAQHNKPN